MINVHVAYDPRIPPCIFAQKAYNSNLYIDTSNVTSLNVIFAHFAE